MGRIGRTFFRVLYQSNRLHALRAVNDVMPRQHLIYLLQYDSVRGNFPVRIEETKTGIRIDGHEIAVFQQASPADIPWKSAGIKTVVDATGVFLDYPSLSGHLTAGAANVVLTTTGTRDIPLFVTGVNHTQWQQEPIISIGSCTVNGTAPLLAQLQVFGVQSVYLNMIHAYSSRQNILDSYYPEIRRSRGAANNIIPLSINLGTSLQRLFPDLQDRIHAMTSRVPVPVGVLADMTCVLSTPPADTQELRSWIKNKSTPVMGYTHDPLVSTDIINNPHSLVVDHEFVHLMGNHARLMTWFDNEWGFSNRIAEWVERLG